MQRFPSNLSSEQLEQRCRRATAILEYWTSPTPRSPRTTHTFAASGGLPIAEVKLIPRDTDGFRMLATVSKGIWSTFTLWRIPDDPRATVTKVTEWSARGAIFRGCAVNDQVEAYEGEGKAVVALSVVRGSEYSIEILALQPHPDDPARHLLSSIKSIQAAHVVVTMKGALLACADPTHDTTILNWRTGESALLRSIPPSFGSGPPGLLSNRCLQVLFLPNCILVVRAREIDLFAFPKLSSSLTILTSPQGSSHEAEPEPEPWTPLASHALGWADHIAIVPQAPAPKNDVPPLAILYRAKSEDPWNADTHAVGHLILYPASIPSPAVHSFSSSPPSPTMATSPPCPYTFPPISPTSMQHLPLPSARGALRAPTLLPRPSGSALFVRPVRELGARGLVAPGRGGGLNSGTDGDGLGGAGGVKEVLVGVVLPGSPLSRAGGREELKGWITSRVVLGNEGAQWCCIDYDEGEGMVVLGAGDGEVRVVML